MRSRHYQGIGMTSTVDSPKNESIENVLKALVKEIILDPAYQYETFFSTILL